jgi:hypothetical protein
MAEFYEYCGSFLSHWWPLVSAGAFFGIDEVAKRHWSWLNTYLDTISARKRRSCEVVAIILAIFWSGYAAWDEERINLLNSEKQRVNSETQRKDAEQKGVKLSGEINDPGGWRDRLSKAQEQLDIANSEARTRKEISTVVSMPTRAGEKSAQEERDPDAIYQMGSIVGHVVAPHINLNRGEINFESIIDTQNLNRTKEVSYRDFRLQIKSVQSTTGSRSIGSNEGAKTQNAVLDNVICEILGKTNAAPD